MSKYRKKPVVVEAERFEPLDKDQHRRCGIFGTRMDVDGPLWYFIETPEGNMPISNFDWIITGVKGELYPCKSDIFELTYELVEEKPCQD